MDYWRGNNFALVRVLASLQVAVTHGIYWFGLEAQAAPLRRVLQFFPGVPVFFFISGLLVARSCLRTTPAEYFRNRSLRTFPALWVCLVLMLVPIFGTSGCSVPSTTSNWLSWWFAQMSFGQMWMPEFLHDCWRTAFNGGRWTVGIELQFYLLLPVLLVLAAKVGRFATALFVALIVASVFFRTWLLDHSDVFPPGWILPVHLSVVTYLWIFLLGVLANHYFDRIAPWFAGKLPWWLCAYAAVVLLTYGHGLRITGNDINPLNLAMLCGLVLSVALSARGFADRVLRGNDFTYGLYLLHPVVQLTMTALGFGVGALAAVISLCLSFASAAASWFFVERPFLRRKRISAQPTEAVPAAPASPPAQPASSP
jgi:peptidoglycan/LPS O-acetylase OafA/YrhL